MNQKDAGSSDQQKIGVDSRGDFGAEGTQRGPGVRLVDWLNGHLMTALGPPPVGPYGEVEAQIAGDCPICAHAMGEHIIDHSTPNTVLTCPVATAGQFDRVENRPLNELGQPKRAD